MPVLAPRHVACRAAAPSVPRAQVKDVVLHGFPTSSVSFLARFAMNVRGIKYRERPLPMITRPDGRPDSRGVKPYIEADGKVIDKGGAIFNFIQENFPGPSLLPESLEARSRSRTIATFCATEMAPYGYFRVIRFLSDELGVSPEGVQKWRAHWLEEGLQAVEEMLEDPDAICVADSDADCVPPKPGKFCIDDAVSMADVFLLPQVHWAVHGPCKVDLARKYPLINHVYQNCMKLEAFQKALPENQPDFKGF